MNVSTVRSALEGWSETPVCGTRAIDETFYAVRDFTPPIDSGLSTVRMIFTDEMLIAWGEIAPVA